MLVLIQSTSSPKAGTFDISRVLLVDVVAVCTSVAEGSGRAADERTASVVIVEGIARNVEPEVVSVQLGEQVDSIGWWVAGTASICPGRGPQTLRFRHDSMNLFILLVGFCPANESTSIFHQIPLYYFGYSSIRLATVRHHRIVKSSHFFLMKLDNHAFCSKLMMKINEIVRQNTRNKIGPSRHRGGYPYFPQVMSCPTVCSQPACPVS